MQQLREWRLALSAACLLLGSGAALGFDQDDLLLINAGPVLLKPQLSVMERFDDNIFYGAHFTTNQVDYDFLTVVSPGLVLSVGRKEGNHFSLGYTYDQRFYAENPDQNAGDHFVNFDSHFTTKRLAIDTQARLGFLSTLFGGGVGFVGSVQRATYNVAPRFTYTLSEKTSVYAEGSYVAYDWESGVRLTDYNVLQGSVGFAYKGLPKTSFFGEIYYGQATSSPNTPTRVLSTNSVGVISTNFVMLKGPPADFIGGFLGAQGQFTPKLSGMIKAGYENRVYANGRTAASAPVAQIAITQVFSEKTALSLDYRRSSVPSVQESGVSYLADAVGLRLTQALGRTGRLAASVGGNFFMYEYENRGNYRGREDTGFRIAAELIYQPQLWLRVNLGYEFEQLDSTAAGIIDYAANRATLKFTIGY